MKLRLVALLVGGICQSALAANDLHRVAWTADPATTATIGWRQLSGSDARVEFGTSADKSGWVSHPVDQIKTMQHPDDAVGTELESQLAFLTGLTPDTAIYYQVCDSEGCSETSWFKTAPAAPKAFSFVAGGDSRTNRQPRQDGNRLVADIRPLFVLFNGDFTDDGNHDQWVQWLEDWQLARSEDGRVYPIVATHGNHENDVIDMLNYVFGIPVEGYYALSVGGNMLDIFTLNTESEPGVGYGAYSAQTDAAWNRQTANLARDAAASDATWKLGNYHRPMRPHTSGKTEGTGRIEAWADTFTNTGFELLVESDTHMAKYTFPVVHDTGAGSYQDFKRDDAKGTMIIGEGSWGAPTRPTDDDKPWTMDSGSFWQFKLVHAQADNMKIHTVRFGSEHEKEAGKTFDPATVTALTQADQDADAFAIPGGLPLWKPLSGAAIDLAADGFKGADIDNQQLIGTGADWKFLDDGSSPDGWQAAGFDDSAWAIGNAQLGYGDGDEATTLSFGDDSKNKRITSYFRRTFNVADATQVIKLTLRLLRDDGAVVYINGSEVARSNMPSGDISAATLAKSSVGGTAEKTYFEYPLLIDLIKDGDNTIAVELHQSDKTSSDLSFDMDLTAVVSNVAESVPETVTTTLSAEAISTSEIKLSWDDDAGFDQVGFQLERKEGAGDWQILSWRLEADTLSYLDAKLSEGASYSYRIRPYNAAGLAGRSNEVAATTLSNPLPVVISEDFESETLGEMTVISNSSDKNWEPRQRDGNNYAYMNGYGADALSDEWLISPPVALDYYSETELNFEVAYNYDGPLLGLKYSADFKADQGTGAATWTDIPECTTTSDALCWKAPAEGNYKWEKNRIDISGLNGEAVVFAFNYTSTGTGGGDGRAWQLDNFAVRGNYEAPAIVGASFDGGIPAQWTVHSSASTANWDLGTKLDKNGVFINGFGADEASEDWLIFPGANLSESDNAALQFDYYQKYSGPALTVRVSSDYVAGSDPATATWTDLNVDFPNLHDQWMEMGPISLADHTGQLHVAFVYTSTGTGPGDGAGMGIANAKVVKNLAGVYQSKAVVEEAFADATALGAFSAVSRNSDADWHIEERADQQGAIISGFGADGPSDDWLISPELQILNWQNAKAQFEIYTKYDGPALQVMISNNYSGSGDPLAEGVSWQPLVIDQSAEVSDAWNAYEVDISAFTGKAYIAFRYTSTGTGSGDGRRHGVDNFKMISAFGKQGLKASFSLAQTQYLTGESISFKANASGGKGPYSYLWEFGDGNSSTEAEPSHSYAAAGSYSVKLSVTDAEGGVKSLQRDDLISVLQATNEPVPVKQGDLRIATFNAYLNRSSEGKILQDARSGSDPQIANVAEIIQNVRPEVLLLNEFDYEANGEAVQALIDNYLKVSQNGAEAIDYPYVYLAESNTGILSEFDFDNDGKTANGGGDAFGFGEFPGQYGMVLLSQYPIQTDKVRTFQKFLWKDMPDAMLPKYPADHAEHPGESWYSDEELAAFRLSSKSHWDVPVDVNGTVVHVLASHPTPPVFDGAEDRNGTRNHDEIRFWRDYVDPSLSGYVYDDKGATGGLENEQRFVILGDLNASADEGDATANPIGMLQQSRLINAAVSPASQGGDESGGNTAFSPYHTADWKMRADYVLPSAFGMKVEQTAVFWPGKADENYRLVGPGVKSSDHRLVYLDVNFNNSTNTANSAATSDAKIEDKGSNGSAGYLFMLLAALAGFGRRLRKGSQSQA